MPTQHRLEATTRPAFRRRATSKKKSAADDGSEPHPMLTLQQQLGNSQVNRMVAALSVQRTPSVAGRNVAHHAEKPNSYVDLLNGINDLTTTAHDGHGTGLADVRFGKRLNKHQQDLLANLRTAILLAYSPSAGSPIRGVELWRSIQGELRVATSHAMELGVPAGDAAEIQRDLLWIGENVMRPAESAAYRQAHEQALKQSDLQTPDLVMQEARLERELDELEQAKEFAEQAGKLTSMGVGQIFLHDAGMGKEVFELLTLPGTIKEKLEAAKEKNLLLQTATAVELVTKVAGLKNTIIKTTFELLEHHAEHAAKEAMKTGAKALAERWEVLAKDYGKYAKTMAKVGTAISVIGVAADAIRAFEAALRGDWDEALRNAGSAGVGLLGALGAEGSGGLLSVITITAKAEMEAIHLAAEFIRWCKDENVRQAAGKFIDTCAAVARYPARDLVADADALFDPSNAAISDLITKKLMRYAPDLRKALAAIGSHVQTTDAHYLGHYGALVDALGPAARRVLVESMFLPDDPLSMATQIRDVFAGANAMAKYVKDYYPTDQEAAAKSRAQTKSKE